MDVDVLLLGVQPATYRKLPAGQALPWQIGRDSGPEDVLWEGQEGGRALRGFR